jgi:hypothetical protein
MNTGQINNTISKALQCPTPINCTYIATSNKTPHLAVHTSNELWRYVEKNGY